MHGGSPSAAYAKLRKESLESEFGHTLGTYGKSVSVVPRFGPFLALYRAAIVSFHVLKLSFLQFFVRDITKRAIKVLDTFYFTHAVDNSLLLLAEFGTCIDGGVDHNLVPQIL